MDKRTLPLQFFQALGHAHFIALIAFLKLSKMCALKNPNASNVTPPLPAFPRVPAPL